MKANTKIMIIIGVIILFSVVLFGCTVVKKEPETIILDAVYEKESLMLDDNFHYSTGLDLYNNVIYICGQMNNSVCIAIIERPSNNINYLSTEISSTAIGFCKTENGYAIISSLYNIETHEKQYILYILSGSGDIIQKIDVSNYIDENYKAILWYDEDSVYIVNYNNCIVVDINSGDNKLLFDTSPIGVLLDVTQTNDNPILLIENQFGIRQLYNYDDSGTLVVNETYNKDFIKTATQIFVDSNTDLLIYNNQGIYHSDNNDIQLILNWNNSGVNKDNIINFAIINEKQFVMLYRNQNNEPSLYYLNAVDNNVDSIRTVVHVTYSETGAKIIPEAAVQFNAQSDKYYVICDEAATIFNETETASATQLSEFDKLILNGNIGDVVIFNTNYQKYIEKDLFLDLYEFIEKDETISKDNLFSCALNSLEYDNHLFVITPYFRIRTLVGKESNISSKNNKTWNSNSLIELNATLSINQQLTAAINRDYFTNILLFYSADTYIDFDNNTCNFDSEFTELLKYIYELPEKNKSIEGINKTKLYKDNTYLLYDATICNIADYLSVKVRFGIDEPLNFIGYPSADGGKAIIVPYDYYAISSDSMVSDGAWEFIKYLISENIVLNSSNSKNYIPILKTIFDEWVDVQQSYVYIYDDNTASYYVEIESRDSDSTFNLSKITDMIAIEFLNYADTINVGKILPKTISDIIIEEIARYFNSSITAEEAVKVIQNRVSIYLAEQG